MNHLLKNDFVSSCTGHMENSGSLSYADLPKVHTFHCVIYREQQQQQQNHHDITGLLEKSKYWEAIKLIVGDMSFPKF